MFRTYTFRLQACCRSSCQWKLSIRTTAVLVASSSWRHASGLTSWRAVDTMQPHRQKTSDEVQSGDWARESHQSASYYPLSFTMFFFQKCHYLPAQMLSGSVKLRVVFVLQESWPLHRTVIHSQQSSCNTEMLNVHRQLVVRSGFKFPA